MTVHDGIQWLVSLGTVAFVIVARDRLRMNEPGVRVALGGVGIAAAFLLFGVIMAVLPRPWESGFSPLVDAGTLVGCAVFGGLIVLSLLEIGGGSLQAIKRWRYYRRRDG